MIESDFKTYRVEQCYSGPNFRCKDLRKREVVEKCAKLICDFNYDEKLLEIKRGPLTSDEFMEDHKKGWYWVCKNEILPLFDELKSRLDSTTEVYKHTFSIINEIKEAIFDKQNKFT